MGREKQQTSATRRKRKAAIAGVLFVALCAAWHVIERLIDVDRYHPNVIAEVQQATGLPASIGELDLDILPWPALDVYAVRIGEADFQASARRITIRAKLSSLFGRAIDITDVKVVGLRVTVPKEPAALRTKWSALSQQLNRPRANVEAPKAGVAAIRTRNAELYRATQTDPAAVFDLDVRDVLGDTATVIGEAVFPELGDHAWAEYEFSIARKPTHEDAPRYEGRVSCKNIDLDRFVKTPSMGYAWVDVEAGVRDGGSGSVAADCTGAVTAKGDAPTLARALAGTFKSNASWSDGQLALNDLTWAASGISFSADITRKPEGSIDCAVSGVTITADGLGPMLALVSGGSFRLTSQPDGQAKIDAAQFGFESDGRLRFAGGTGHFRGLAVTNKDGGALFPDIEGVVRVAEDTSSPATGEFHGDSAAVEASLHVQSEKLDAMACEGRYTFADRTWRGTASGDVQRFASPFTASQSAQKKLPALLSFYGRSTFDVTASFPTEDVPELRIALVREGQPPFEGEILFTRGNSTSPLSLVRATASAPLNMVNALLPSGMTADGPVRLEFRRNIGEQRQWVDIQLSDASIKAGRYWEKKPGGIAKATITGPVTAEGWQPDVVVLNLLDQVQTATAKGSRWYMDPLKVNLESLAGLLPEGASAGGAVSGRIATSPLSVSLEFDQAALSLTPGLAIRSVTGHVDCENGYWTISDLTFLGANSECSVTAGLENKRWQGTLTGATLDLNALAVMVDAASALRGQSNGGQESQTKRAPLVGSFTVDLDTVYWRRARMDNVHADLEIGEDNIQFQNVRIEPYGGLVAGTGILSLAAGSQPNRLGLDLALQDVDLRVIDELLSPEPRDLKGKTTGRLVLDAPIIAKSPLASTNGRIEFTATNGSFGKFGLATKILAAVRTTEVFRLNVPSFKDEGLIYDECSGRLSMKDGLLTVEDFALLGAPLVMSAAGAADFRRDATDLEIRVGFLDGIAETVGKVPGLGSVMGVLTKHAALRLEVTGSPYDPKVQAASVSRLEQAGDTIKDAAKGAVKAITKRVKIGQ